LTRASTVRLVTCHNSELFYQGKRIRIDGDVGMHFQIQTFSNGTNRSIDFRPKGELRERFGRDAERIHYYMNRIVVTPHEWGPGRIDALNLIINR
jgi:hypothetical protein